MAILWFMNFMIFAERFLSDKVISTNHTRLSHTGSASQNKQLFRRFAHQTFLPRGVLINVVAH
jgi:hypothetical protein